MGVYGKSLGEVFHLERTPAFVTATLRHGGIGVTHVQCTVENNGLTTPIARQDAFLVNLQLKTCPAHELWVDGKATPTGWFEKGTTAIYDLRANPIVYSVSPFELLSIFIPRAAIDAFTVQDGAPRIDAFNNNPGLGADDKALSAMGQALLPGFAQTHGRNQVFVDHLLSAIVVHLCSAYGGAKSEGGRRLSFAQERRAKERLSADLVAGASISELARECGLPLASFAEAFHITTGLAPHRWLDRCRAARAIDLLMRSSATAETIAHQCGFAGVTRMQRVIARETAAN